MARILIVDDDPDICFVFTRLLERHGHEASAVLNGHKAEEILESSPFDIAIIDIIMPDMDGIELIMKIRLNYPRLRVIAISGGGRISAEEYLRMAKLFKVHHTFQKPVKADELLTAINELMTELGRGKEARLMDIICSYCKTPIRTVKFYFSGSSDGVCRNCLPKLVKDLGQPLAEFVNEMSTPILVMHNDTRIVAANTAARKLSAEPLQELSGLLCGDVIGCLHSKEEEGCGRTVHCLSCTIRRSIAHTFETGESCFDVPAYMDLDLLSGDTKVRFRISTEKKGDFVLLRIEHVEETPKGEPTST